MDKDTQIPEVKALETQVQQPELQDVSTNFLVIDFFNRKIRNVPAKNIGLATKKFLKLDEAFLLSGILEADATVVSVDGDPGTEATLNSYTIPLNTISRNDSRTEKAGNVFRVRASGRYTTDDATATFSLALKVGSTTYHTIVSTGATVTNAPWSIDWLIIISAIGTSGTAESYASAKINNVNKDSASTATQAIDTTANQIISLTATWTGSAGDDISIRQFIVEILN